MQTFKNVLLPLVACTQVTEQRVNRINFGEGRERNVKNKLNVRSIESKLRSSKLKLANRTTISDKQRKSKLMSSLKSVNELLENLHF